MDSLVWKDQEGNESKAFRTQSQHGCQHVSVIVSLLLLFLLITVIVFGEAALRRGGSLKLEGLGLALVVDFRLRSWLWSRVLLERLSWHLGAGVCGAQTELLFSPRSPAPCLSLWDRVLFCHSSPSASSLPGTPTLCCIWGYQGGAGHTQTGGTGSPGAPTPRCLGCPPKCCPHSLPWPEDAAPGPHHSQGGGWGKVGTIRLHTTGLRLALRTRCAIESRHRDGKRHEDGDAAEAAIGH